MGRVQQALFLKGADGLGAEFHLDFAAVNNKRFHLKVGFPNLLGVALGETDIAAVLLAFAGEVTLLHNDSLDAYSRFKVLL